jgi:hypothetical protein
MTQKLRADFGPKKFFRNGFSNIRLTQLGGDRSEEMGKITPLELHCTAVQVKTSGQG